MKLLSGQVYRVIPLALALVSAPISVWGEEPISLREALASKIVSNRENTIDQEEFGAAMTDAAARPLFKKIRTDSNWGPEHPTWKKLFSEFRAEFERLIEGLSMVTEEQLKTALATSLTEKELSELVVMQSDPRFLDIYKLLKQLGLDGASTMRIMAVVTTPALYSQTEKDSLKEKFSLLKEREKELEALKPRIDAALKSLQTPAFTKYQMALIGTLSESLRRLESDESAKQQLKSFLVAWQDKVKQD